MPAAFVSKREWLVVIALVIVFFAIRLPGFDLPYHQDEWKNAQMVRIGMEGGLSAHPPLMELIYLWSGDIFGADNLRLMPLVFGVLSAFLLYVIVRRRIGIRAALAATGLYAIATYSVLASLMLDMDGTILPTFFLAAVYAYDRFTDATTRRAWLWLGAVGIAVMLGFLTKLSFVLVPGALFLDYLWRIRDRFSLRLLTYCFVTLAAFGGAAVGALVYADRIVPAFDLGPTIAHATSYVRFEGRGYIQIIIQGMKAIFYLSPLLILMPFFATKELFEKNRIFIIYGILGFIFYFILFDFSEGALDKYLMYSIVPLCAIAGSVLGARFSRKEYIRGFTIGAVASVALLILALLTHEVMPLYPKTAWLDAVLSGRWNILMPFTGGNGPLGFYMSFVFMAAAFITSTALTFAGLIWSNFRQPMMIALVIIGLTYNVVFIQELYRGTLYGSAPKVLAESIAFIAEDEGIRSVITHADAGAYELSGVGKYVGRFYAVPAYAEGHKALFANHTGHFLVVDMPLLNKQGFYRSFFDTCTALYETHSGVIKGYVYNCVGSDPYAIR